MPCPPGSLPPTEGRNSGLNSLRGSPTFLCTPVCAVLSSVGCQSPRLRSRSLRPHLSAGRASTGLSARPTRVLHPQRFGRPSSSSSPSTALYRFLPVISCRLVPGAHGGTKGYTSRRGKRGIVTAGRVRTMTPWENNDYRFGLRIMTPRKMVRTAVGGRTMTAGRGKNNDSL